MSNIPRISESEWIIMKILWENSPLTANQIIDKLDKTVTWKPKTIKTLLNRLMNKQAIGFNKSSRYYIYYPLVDEAECIKAESKSFLDRIYGGAFHIMMANFIEDQNLSKNDIMELKKILDKKDENKER